MEMKTKDRPDETGIVRRGEAVGFHEYMDQHEAPPCFVGQLRHEERCERPAVMEVYGLTMCEIHGEEAACSALEELAHHVEEGLERPFNPHVGPLNPDLARALRTAGSEIEEAGRRAVEQDSEALLRAFPLDRDKAEAKTIAYANDPDSNGRGTHEPPADMWQHYRMVICRHMRLAFEDEAGWLVEMLENERVSIAAQAAYALALEREAGLR